MGVGPERRRGLLESSRRDRGDLRRAARRHGEGPFLRTGDLGFLRDGELFITGRLKDLIILRGANHYPQDIELTAEQSHPALRRGCGAAFSLDVDGEERLGLVYEVDPRESHAWETVGAAVGAAVRRKHLVNLHAVALVAPRSVPKTSSGKFSAGVERGVLAASLETVLGMAGTRTANSSAVRQVRRGRPGLTGQGRGRIAGPPFWVGRAYRR